MMSTKGIDISDWQSRSIDFKKLKTAGIDFVIIRAGFGNAIAYPTQYDDNFEYFYKAAKSAGLHVGAYWYCYCTDVKSMEAEAKSFLKAIKGKQLDYPVFFDIEDRTQQGISKYLMSQIVNAGCKILEDAGWWVGIYSYTDMLNRQFEKSICDRYSLWVAEWGSRCTYNGSVNIWQDSDEVYYNGYSGRLDGDISYENYPARIKAAGKNGYSKPTPKILDKTGMKQGDKNLGVYELKSMLSIAEARGIIKTHVTVDDGFGSGTTQIVNNLLAAWGYSQNDIAGKNFIKKLSATLK